MTQPGGQLASISLDCPDTDRLAGFYARLLGLEEAFATPDRGVVALAGASSMLTLMCVDQYVAPHGRKGPSSSSFISTSRWTSWTRQRMLR